MLVTVGMLEMLAQSPSLSAGDLETFHTEASRVVARHPAWHSVLLFRPDGQQLVNTTHPWGTALVRVNEPASFAEVVAARRPVVGNLARGQVTGQLAFPVRVPVMRGKQVIGVLTAAVRPSSLQALLLEAAVPRGEWTRAFTDRSGRIAARTRDPERFVGELGAPEFVERRAARSEDLYRDRTIDGADVYVAFSRAAFSGWTAAVAFPIALIDAPVRRSLAITTGVGLVLTAVTGTGAYLVGRRIARPIREATVAAQALARGEHLPVTHSAVREFAGLGSALARSAELLRERERERDAADRAKDAFLATLSHELRTPLTAMVGWVRLLRQGILAPDRARHALEVVDRNLAVQTRLIADLLDVSRIVAGKLRLEPQPVDVRDVVQDAVEQVRHQAEHAGVGIGMTLPAEPAVVDGDRPRLVQVVGNLLSNSVKFTPRGGSVSVDVSADDAVEIAVHDTGLGIAAEALPHVFEPFHQADETTGNARGLGLGLAIVKNIVELHGGHVEASSAGEGLGTRFVITLPRASAGDATSAAPERRRPREGLRVLVVDDDPDHLDVLTTMLSGSGLVVTPVGSVEEALSVWQRESFDAVVSDLRMPDRDGYALAQEIRRRENGRPRIRAIAVSANAAAQDVEQARAAGFDAHVAKPVDPEELLAALA
jgi:signal transduction histidine kinase